MRRDVHLAALPGRPQLRVEARRRHHQLGQQHLPCREGHELEAQVCGGVRRHRERAVARAGKYKAAA